MSRFLHQTFDEIAPGYERMNHAMTLGLDILWRRATARIAASIPSSRRLDVCTGTAETAVLLKGIAPEPELVVGADFSAQMMAVAKQKPETTGISFVGAEAGNLPFADGRFDLVTVTLATRNLASSAEGLQGCFAEFHRVLKPGGRFINLETSQPPNRLVWWGFRLYVAAVVPLMAWLLSGFRPGYAYLARSIPRFHDADGLAQVLRESGFAEVSYRRLFLGAAAIHVATKAGS
ncbi:ubiquinone/menaquinone biosynthesis methyltransferase [bacterium]|nr:ubiquinone/menaquinone biosynthesis methyltransferase [bacterium]